MNSLKLKLNLKKKKKLKTLISKFNIIDETSIKYKGNINDNLTIIIKKSIEDALALKSSLPKWILKLEGLSGIKYRHFVNSLARRMINPAYLEIGSWLGSTACSVMYKNTMKVTCVDNWSQVFNDNNKPMITFKNNIKKCLDKNISFQIFNNNFRKVQSLIPFNEFNIYFYDGPHHYKDHYDGIYLLQKNLANKYILIVDDWNWLQVRKGTKDAIKDCNLKTISLTEIRTTQDSSKPIFQGEFSEWHNGYGIFVIQK